MLNRLQKSKDDKGFTLIELLVVVVIIGILAAVAIPLFLAQKDKAAEAGVKSDVKSAQSYMESYFVDNNTYVKGTVDPLADLKVTEGTTLKVVGATVNSYCIEGVGATKKVFSLKSDTGAVKAGACA